MFPRGLFNAPFDAFPAGELGIEQEHPYAAFLLQEPDDIAAAVVLGEGHEEDVPEFRDGFFVLERLRDGIEVKFDIYEGILFFVAADNFFLTTPFEYFFRVDRNIVVVFSNQIEERFLHHRL